VSVLATPLGVWAETNVSGLFFSAKRWNATAAAPPPRTSASTVSPCVAGATFAQTRRSWESNVFWRSAASRIVVSSVPGVTRSTTAISLTRSASGPAPEGRPVKTRYCPGTGGVCAGRIETMRFGTPIAIGSSAISSSSLSACTTVLRKPNQLRCSPASNRILVVLEAMPKSARADGSTVSAR
jgi:hypothetical protein